VLYKWNKAADGTYTIFNVPIFSQHDTSFREYSVEEEDIKSCVKNLSADQIAGHLAPIHGYHHDRSGTKVNKLAYICNPHIEDLGKYGATVVVDFISINKENFDAIQKGEWPYRSVEGYFNPEDRGKSNIRSLALLSDEAPFFNYTMLFLASVQAEREGIDVRAIVAVAPEQFKYSEESLALVYTVENKFKFKELRKMEEKKLDVIVPEVKTLEVKTSEVKTGEAVQYASKEEVQYASKEEVAEIKTLLDKVIELVEGKSTEAEDAVKDEEITEGEDNLVMASALGYVAQGYSQEDAIKLARVTYKLDVTKPVLVAKTATGDFYKATGPTIVKEEEEEDYGWKTAKNTYKKSKESFIGHMKKNAHKLDAFHYRYDSEKGCAVRRNK